MPSNYTSLTVDWYDETDGYTTTADITADVKGIPLFTDTGTGEVNQATIVIRALNGNYITTGNIIDNHDRIHIRCTDLGSNSYSRFFEVIDVTPSTANNEGALLKLECLGIEYHLQQIHVVKPYYFENAFNVVSDLGDMYNENNGSEQPTLANHNVVWNVSSGDGNALPKWTANNFEYGLNEETVYNRMLDVMDKMFSSVSAGGAGLRPFELSFRAIIKDGIVMRLRNTGDNTSSVTIKNAKVTNPKTVGENEGVISNPTGTNVLAWGSPDHGSLPVEFSRYESGLIQFLFRPEWVSGLAGGYPSGAKVKVTTSGIPKHYQSDIDDNTDTPPTNWTQIDMSDEFGDSIQYSPWTDDKAQLWANCGSDPSNSFAGSGMWDINLVIWDDIFFRTWADARARTDAELDALAVTTGDGYSYDGTRDAFPRGFRILVDADAGAATGDLSGFDDQLVEWNGSEWVKKYSFDSNNDNAQVAVIDEGKIYEYDHAGTSWTDISGSDYANDCFHPFTQIQHVDGIDLVNGTPRSEITDNTNYPDITSDGSQFAKNINSAIEFTFTHGNIVDVATDASTPTGDYYKRGAWVCFRFPFPNNNYNGITEGVGDLYGGGTNSVTEPSTLDIENMHLTHDGLRGFNQGSSSEDFGQINSVAFWMKFSITVAGNELSDEHVFRAFMIDTADNIVYQDFSVDHSNNWQDIRLPISGFRIYRGRKPAYGWDAIIATFVPPKELEVVNNFEWRNVKFFGIQYQPVYDDVGRFAPGLTIDEPLNSVGLSGITGSTMKITLDGFRFIKPLLVTSGQETTINLEPMFIQQPNITVYDQLLNDAKSQLEIEKFKHKEFNVDTSGDDVFDINFADSFYLENDKLVSDSDNGANTIELVAKRIEYSLTKPRSGPGGLRRRILGVKVFE